MSPFQFYFVILYLVLTGTIRGIEKRNMSEKSVLMFHHSCCRVYNSTFNVFESLKSSWVMSLAQSRAVLSLTHSCQIKLISDGCFISRTNGLHAGERQGRSLFVDRPSLLQSAWAICYAHIISKGSDGF